MTELGGGETHTTNNRMELTGAIEALAHLEHVPGPVAIYTDSTYVIKGIREWIWAWRRRGWKTAEGKDVLNRDLWEQLSSLVEARGKGDISWHYVRGHAGHLRQRACRRDRRQRRARVGVELYRGELAGYGAADSRHA